MIGFRFVGLQFCFIVVISFIVGFPKMTTAEDGPEVVSSLSAYFDEPTKLILVNWAKTSRTNGMIRAYSVKLVHQKWRHSCLVPVPQIAFNVSREVNSVVFNSTQFKFSSSYAVYVAAITDKIKGPYSMELISTPESIPEAGPKNLTVTRVTSTGYRIEWESPDCAFSNGRITFNITSYGVPIKSEYTVTSIVYMELIPNTEYEDTIIPCTTAGCGKLTASITVTTLASKPRPGPPRDLTVYSVTNNSLSVTWLPPISSPSKVRNYRIAFKKNCPANSSHYKYEQKEVEKLRCKNSKLRRDRLCHTITRLEPKTDYDIYVTAIDDMGEESIRKETHTTGRTEESKPEAPSKLKLENSTTTSLFVSWMEPVRANGKLIEYRINVKLMKMHGLGLGNNSVVYSFVQHTPDVTIHNITGLERANTYDVTVEAATSAGYGPPVHKLLYTRNSAPKITVRTKVGEILSLQLLIKPINEYNRPISAYFVLVKDVTNKPVKREELEFNTYNQSKIEYVAAKLNPLLLVSEGANFTIGDGKYYHEFYNAPLQNGHEYIFGTAVLSEVDGEQQITFEYLDEAVYVSERLPQIAYSLTSPLIPQMGFIISTIILAVILVFVVIFFILHCKKPELFCRATKGTSTDTKTGAVKEGVTFTKPAEVVYEEIDTKSVYLMNLNDSVDVNRPNPDSPTYVNCLAQRHLFA